MGVGKMQEEMIQYAPYIIIVIMFCANYKIFITPDALEKKLKDYVLKEAHDLTINAIKEDIAEIKKDNAEIKKELTAMREQQTQLYNKIMSLV